eukprot:10400-Hanusia_phi.AAC.2
MCQSETVCHDLPVRLDDPAAAGGGVGDRNTVIRDPGPGSAMSGNLTWGEVASFLLYQVFYSLGLAVTPARVRAVSGNCQRRQVGPASET